MNTWDVVRTLQKAMSQFYKIITANKFSATNFHVFVLFQSERPLFMSIFDQTGSLNWSCARDELLIGIKFSIQQ